MELMLLRVFQTQTLRQCKYVLSSARELDAALKNRDIDRVFYALQNLLNAGANISKALWGQGGKLAEQRKPLRDSIGITDASPLKEVTMRNNFEHFDERLDRWWSKSANHNIADHLVGPPDIINGLLENEKFRHYDPTTTNVIFWGQEFNVRRIVEEINRVLPALELEASKPHWEIGNLPPI
ncbi:hypothetical protein [Bradyrhizobium sp. ORS 86]|uniref:hypothetical protein n=1 Tax=Bradyrhizobium sp. ORS 86 TaxID=1685970 RepID=UPI003890028E